MSNQGTNKNFRLGALFLLPQESSRNFENLSSEMETLHEVFFGADGILPSLGMNKTEIKKRCHVDLNKSFVDSTSDFRAFEAVASFLFKLIDPKAYKNSCIEILHPTSNRKEEAEVSTF